MLLGATGSGKTTLINSMINYIFNVRWDDPFRFQLIDEQTGKSQMHSHTSCITTYDIHHADGFRIPYSVTIVDTPGYGDTRGFQKDQEITEMIRKFFNDKNGIQEFDVVGFVVPFYFPRLTHTLRYIFDSMLSIFDKDVEESITFLLTFSDSQFLPVLKAIVEANLPCLIDSQTGYPTHHKFNNSAFFCWNRESRYNTSDKFNKFFWDMGIENFEKFFTSLTTTKTKSLSLTKQVLEERKQLKVTLEELTSCLDNLTPSENVLLETFQKSMDKKEKAVLETVEALTKRIAHLEEIALWPNLFLSPEYIDVLIREEGELQKIGFEERVKSLIQLRKQVELISKIRNIQKC